MKDVLSGGTWSRWILAAITYALFSVLPAMLILRYVIQIDLAVLMAVLVVQAVLFIIFRRKFYETAAGMVSAVCGLLKPDIEHTNGGVGLKSHEVIFDKEEVHALSALMFCLAAMTILLVGFFSSWDLDLRLSLGGLIKFVGLLLAVYIGHEALHGLAAMAWGKIPFSSLHFGINTRLVALYCHADKPMTRSAFRAFAVLPIIVTTPIAVLVLLLDPALWSLFLLSATFAGGAGDIMVFLRVRRYDNDAWIQDHASEVGFITFPPGETPVR
ncbi:MAG: DUF3267 domain-containing protein [Gemmatimonadota bacterium]|nr:DUF3267 domain-containing protein [Gemmatimonadota bacterium]